MKERSSNAAKELLVQAAQYRDVSFHEQLYNLITSGTLDFDSWTSLVSEVDKNFADDIETISLVYDSFLSQYPLCHVYWTNYAHHMAHLSSGNKAVEIFEQAVESATFSMGLWVDYCSFGMSAYADLNQVRRLFKRGISFVGKDYYCHTLWDRYMKFEFSRHEWSSLAHVHIQALKFPTKKLHIYYDYFRKLVAILEEKLASKHNCSVKVKSEAVTSSTVKTTEDEIYHVIRNLESSDDSLRSKALHQYKFIGEIVYKKACELDEKIRCFETCIGRRYFDVKPLDDDQLKTWHGYLDFIEKQKDLDWALRLYERCLISCANYPEFWVRYVEFVETNGGRELAISALDRASKVFLKNVPEIHLFNARFKEKIGDADGARAVFLQCDAQSNSYFTENVIREANMEKRLGNLAAAFCIYEKALEMAAERQELHTVPMLYIHFSRLKLATTGDAEAARDVIIEGIQHVPHCRLLLEELIKFAMIHEGSAQVDVLDSLVANAILPGLEVLQGLCTKDREELSLLYLEFVDLCGTIHDIRKAWNRHVKLFPHLIRTSFNQMFSTTIEQSSSLVAVPTQPSGACSSGRLTQLPLHDEGLLPENHILPAPVLADQTPVGDIDNTVQERIEQSSLKTAPQPTDDAHIVHKLTQDLVHQSLDDLSVPMESNEVDTSGQMVSTCDVVNQPRENMSVPLKSIHNSEHQSGEDSLLQDQSIQEFGQPLGRTVPLELSQEHEKTIIILQRHENEVEKHVKSISLESLSISSGGKECRDIIPMVSDEHHVLQETSLSGASTLVLCENINGDTSISTDNKVLVANSAQLMNKPDETASDSRSASVNPNFEPRQKHVLSEAPLDTRESGLQRDHMDTTSGSTASVHHWHSQDKNFQQIQASQQEVPAGEMHALGRQTPQIQKDKHINYQASDAQGTTTSSPAWQLHNTLQQSSVSESQSQMSSYPQAQVSHYPTHNNQQTELTQHNHAYNQMLQYYYQQQYQQQLLQLQQSYAQLQQSNQQSYQLQPQQQQLSLLQQQQYFQQQQQYLLYQLQGQQQQCQQLVPQVQQQQVPQQQQQLEVQKHDQQPQEYYQSQESAYQQYQQGYQQQVDQTYQLLEQHYKLYQEQGYQQLLHQYQLQQGCQLQQGQHQPQPLQDEQKQTTSAHTLTWHRGNHELGQENTPSHDTATRGPSESSHCQQQSPQLATPNQQQSPNGPSPSSSAAATAHGVSSHLGQHTSPSQ